MKINKLFVVGVSVVMLGLTACSSGGLSYEEAEFGLRGLSGQYEVVDDAFYQTDTVEIHFFGLGPFERGEDDLFHFDMDIKLYGPDGELYQEAKEILGAAGDKGSEEHYQNYANDVVARYVSGDDDEPGTYRFDIHIYDEVNGNSVDVSKTFELLENDF